MGQHSPALSRGYLMVNSMLLCLVRRSNKPRGSRGLPLFWAVLNFFEETIKCIFPISHSAWMLSLSFQPVSSETLAMAPMARFSLHNWLWWILCHFKWCRLHDWRSPTTDSFSWWNEWTRRGAASQLRSSEDVRLWDPKLQRWSSRENFDKRQGELQNSPRNPLVALL